MQHPLVFVALTVLRSVQFAYAGVLCESMAHADVISTGMLRELIEWVKRMVARRVMRYGLQRSMAAQCAECVCKWAVRCVAHDPARSSISGCGWLCCRWAARLL
jgi:hypothetical protein